MFCHESGIYRIWSSGMQSVQNWSPEESTNRSQRFSPRLWSILMMKLSGNQRKSLDVFLLLKRQKQGGQGNFVTEVGNGEYRRIPAMTPEATENRGTWNDPYSCRCRTGRDRDRWRRNPGHGTGIDLHGAKCYHWKKTLQVSFSQRELNADTLLILTSVEKVSLNKDTDKGNLSDTVSVADAANTSMRISLQQAPCFQRSKCGHICRKKAMDIAPSSQILLMQRWLQRKDRYYH